VLVDDGILEKRRGIGMFVVGGARQQLILERRKRFAEQYIDPMLAEAHRLAIDVDALVDMVRQPANPERHQISYPQGEEAS